MQYALDLVEMCLCSPRKDFFRVHAYLNGKWNQPNKFRVVLEMRSPRNLKEVQQLNGHIAALTRFMAKELTNSCFYMPYWRKEWSPDWLMSMRKQSKVTRDSYLAMHNIMLCKNQKIGAHTLQLWPSLTKKMFD